MKKKQISLILIFLLVFIFQTNIFANTNAVSITVEIPGKTIYDLSFSDKIEMTYNERNELGLFVDGAVVFRDELISETKRTFKINATSSEDIKGTIMLEDDLGVELAGELNTLKEVFINLGYYERDRLAYYSNKYMQPVGKTFEGERLTITIKAVNKDSKPALSGKDTVINNIDRPYTTAQIRSLANLKAYDDYDHDITNKITIKEDKYTPNNTKLGTFQITFTVTNTMGLSTDYVLNVRNMDFTKPIITGPTTKTINYKTSFDIEEIKSQIVVSDNSGEEVPLLSKDNNYVKDVPGTYTFNFEAKDKSGNISKHVFTLKVIDETKPVISDESVGKIEINYKDKITDELLLSGLSANDEIDGNLTSKIKIVTNQVKNTLGTYVVTYQVSDNSGNIESYERTFEVVSYDYPSFWVSKNLVSIEDVNEMSLEQLATLFASYEGVELLSFEVLEDNYTNMSKVPGKYKVILKIVDINYNEFIIEKEINVVTKTNIYKPKNVGLILSITALTSVLLFTGLALSIKKRENKIDN